MPKFNIMAEKITYVPYFKVFEADTQAEAEKAAKDEVDELRCGQELDQLGWEEGDSSDEYEMRPMSTEQLTDVAPFADLPEGPKRDQALDRWRKA